MKETIKYTEYAQLITEMIPKGVLLNTNGDKFNSMVIGWGNPGTLWGRPVFLVYVRQSRYTKPQLDKTWEFTVSVPLEKIDPVISKVCGSQSGYDIDKVAEAGLTLEDARTIHTPGIKEYPLTLECKVLYAQDQVPADIPEDILKRYYPTDEKGNCDYHTMYVGEIVDSYIIRD